MAEGNENDAKESVRKVVYICDDLVPRATALCEMLKGAGVIAEVGSLSSTVVRGNGNIAVFALGNIFRMEAPSLKMLGRFKTLGYLTIAYEDGADAWPLAIKCRPLLAGATKLLDSGKADFPERLAAAVIELQMSARDAQVRREDVLNSMRRHGLVGCSSIILGVFQKAMRFSELSDLPVLITGESGTGKELVARAIARMDPKRSAGPFVAVNCAAVPTTMVESEFFGHRRGAFTGAERDRKGWIRAAEGGVLFLDEIGEMDVAVQGKFLRVLQEHCVRGLGDDHESAVKTRFLAATNRDLQALVKAGKFRNDLFERLRVLEVEMPNLSQRKDDIGPLIEHFARKHEGVNVAQRTIGISADYIAAVEQMDLPGNIRQLENVVRQSLINHDSGGELGLQDLPREFLGELARGERQSEVELETVGEPTERFEIERFVQKIVRVQGLNLQITMRECERIVCNEALKAAQGNQTEAARLLGITSRSVYNKLHKYGNNE